MASRTTNKPAQQKDGPATGQPSQRRRSRAATASATETSVAEKDQATSGEKPAVTAGEPGKREVLSLIDKQKEVRRREPGAQKPLIPVISKKIAPPAKLPDPPAPASAPAPEPPAGEQAEEKVVEITESGEKILHLKPPIIVRDLAAALNVKPFVIIRELMDELNFFAKLNEALDTTLVEEICKRHGFTFEKEKRQKEKGVHKPKPPEPPPVEAPKPPVEELLPRAPIVTFMGHVDHGKTSLLDAIRKTRVAQGEAGGITQHIGASLVEHNGQRITFLDTPGHEAFTAMRARGANVTDIVVLVVAANDGLMPQTLEAISHAKAAGVPMIVAINKIDLPGANVDKVKGQLQEQGLTPEEWGGQTICCPVSALKGDGIDHLLDMILLQAEILELKASVTAPPRCTIIEAQMESGRGPTGTVIVRSGTLKPGQPFICGIQWGKVKALIDDQGRNVKAAGPSTPVKVLGFSGMPNAGDELVVMPNERDARALSAQRIEEQRTAKLATPQRATLENLFQTLTEGQKPCLKIVLKTDVQGSLEAVTGSLQQIKSQKVDLDIIHGAVGPVSENDVLLASASNAVVIGFNTRVENNAANTAKREGVQIKLYSIIYELIDQVKDAMAGLLEPETRETAIGHAEVRQVFALSKGVVAGCYVSDGRILRSARARVLRRRQPIYDGAIATLRRFQDDVKEVRSGLECGIKLGDFNGYEPGDVIECYTLEKIVQKL